MYLIVTNHGRRPCRVPALPTVTLRDAHGRVLPIDRRAPAGMHSGPAIVPVRLAPGGSARAGLRWISGPIFPHSRRYEVATASVTIDGRQLTIPLAASIYGETGARATFEQQPLAPPAR